MLRSYAEPIDRLSGGPSLLNYPTVFPRFLALQASRLAALLSLYAARPLLGMSGGKPGKKFLLSVRKNQP
jgi:hypothetical protein